MKGDFDAAPFYHLVYRRDAIITPQSWNDSLQCCCSTFRKQTVTFFWWVNYLELWSRSKWSKNTKVQQKKTDQQTCFCCLPFCKHFKKRGVCIDMFILVSIFFFFHFCIRHFFAIWPQWMCNVLHQPRDSIHTSAIFCWTTIALTIKSRGPTSSHSVVCTFFCDSFLDFNEFKIDFCS